MKKHLVLLLAISFLAKGALFAEMEYPNWLLGKSPEYPEDKFVLAVGEADDMYAAKQAAFAELSKLFESRMLQIDNELTRDKAISLKKAKENKKDVFEDNVEEKERISQETLTLVEGLLDSSKIVDTWYNGKTSKYYALAVINKTAQDEEMVKYIKALDEIINVNIEKANSTYVYLEKVKYCNIVLRTMKRKDEIVNRKRIIDPLAIGYLSKGPLRAQIEKKRDEFISKVVFQVVDVSDEKIGVKKEVEDVVAASGYKLSAGGDAATLVLIRCSVNIDAPRKNDEDIKFMHWIGKLELVEGGQDGRVISQTFPEGQATDKTVEKARERAVDTSKKAIGVAAKYFLKSFISGYK